MTTERGPDLAALASRRRPIARDRRSYGGMRLRPLWMCAGLLSGCSSAPSHPILGSYFPSWMFCALAGLGVAALLRQLFVALGIDRALPAPLLVYLALAVAAAFATWLIWLDQPLHS